MCVLHKVYMPPLLLPGYAFETMFCLPNLFTITFVKKKYLIVLYYQVSYFRSILSILLVTSRKQSCIEINLRRMHNWCQTLILSSEIKRYICIKVISRENIRSTEIPLYVMNNIITVDKEFKIYITLIVFCIHQSHGMHA